METVGSDVIHGYHAHINFDLEVRDTAVALREEIGKQFDVILGRVWDKPIGPHLKSMFQVAFGPNEFSKFVPWLMVNHQGLAIFIHPETGDEVADHRDNAMWINEKLGVDLSALD
ncbi:MAG: DOPA 4,5-dioxygenase family protein [Alphaproteobacteria bacterium]|jgi:aromatic ring-cleaving dioxygenase|nr:DOPA 4,5-dioxygenase family protein [Rhodospirillaceae bacterium]MDG2479766.1 DOPA 4,5-dioxygenase family protein [Alphaproteobacteria bacterium]MBT6202631.1 DOPA 4,5-dioxygenase family protein [Rhodospirillaceae bacterium]MBT6511495.1 DOPA 4,5-dioxygenase family protein [Rhodospirillaceae bacterium]MBT7614984.1 DOPA 4,5-dioxygenase family protein [Rhodospirillaceae bacterium]